MTSTENKRGTKRSADDLAEEDDFQRYGKLLWESLVYHKKVTDLVALIPSPQGDGKGFFIIGFDANGIRRRTSEPVWPNYRDIWLATRRHPGETVETIDSRPTQKEVSERMEVFISEAVAEQNKCGLSRNKSGHGRLSNIPGGGAIIVSGPSHKSAHHVTKSRTSPPLVPEHERFDFYDGLAHAARQKSIQETYGLRAHIKHISTMLEDARAALIDEKQAHRQDAEDTRKEIAKLTEEAEKNIHGLSAMLDEERKSSKDRAETADTKINDLVAQLEKSRKAHEKDMQDAESEIQQLRADIDANKNAASSELKKEKEARRKAAKESSAVIEKLQKKHKREQQDHDEEKKSLLMASEESTAKIQSLEGKVQALSAKFDKERQDRREAIDNAVEEAQLRMAKHHKEKMKEIATRYNGEKRCLQKKVKDSENELLRLKDDYQKQSQELEKEQSDRRQEEADYKLERQCLESENERLRQEKEAHAQLRDKIVKLEETNRALQTTVNRFIAVANDVRP